MKALKTWDTWGPCSAANVNGEDSDSLTGTEGTKAEPEASPLESRQEPLKRAVS